ncbi:protein-tyrosine phosphatase-like protein [Durotheca rogersii]|uniref:protein-tyrosine phosphatase-like protein n=1 Tax=Durotheca rogersii TaxID=419775 RepID=UPI00222119DC|nr:protein-tyrosine phosphatase-like protein [Durotheca rogersii]KAI5861184.1 protein-tyrosine phosphatase-like protein [Durotheca rogersii]
MADAASLLALAQTDVWEEIPASAYGPALQAAPFVQVEGAFNARDVGLVPGSPVRAGFAFRSGALAGVGAAGAATLARGLGVRRVFDLRSAGERARAPDPAAHLAGAHGVDLVWLPSARPDTTPDLARFAAGAGEAAYREMYLEVVDVYRASWRAVLEHVRDRPAEPFLVHCTAGRDRTGVLAGLLLALAGAPRHAVVLDYLLSRIGTEPVRPMLLQFALAGSRARSPDDPGFYNLVSLRAECWDAFAAGVQEVYGGFEAFVARELGFSPDDIKTIKENLIKPPA